MRNRGKVGDHKSAIEYGREVWKLTDKDGNIINTYRGKQPAQKEKNRLERLYLEEIKLERMKLINTGRGE